MLCLLQVRSASLCSADNPPSMFICDPFYRSCQMVSGLITQGEPVFHSVVVVIRFHSSMLSLTGWSGAGLAKIRLFSQFQFSLRKVESWHTVAACKSRGLW